MNHLELFSGTHSFGKVSSLKGNNVISLDRDMSGKCPFSDYDNSDYHIKEDILEWDYKIYPPYYFDLITASPVCLWWSRLRYTWIGRKIKAHGDKIITKEILQQDIDNLGKPMVDKVFEIIEYFKPKFWLIENPSSGLMKHYIEEQYPQYNTYTDFSYCKFSDWGYQKNTRFWSNIKGLECVLCNKDCDNIITINKDTQHKKVLANGYEIINGEKVLCNTKELRTKFREQKIHSERMGTSKTILDNGKTIRCNTKILREKYKDYENIQKKTKKHSKDVSKDIGGGTNRLERYRIPTKLIEHIFNKLS